jgi:hypothetical protein
MGASRRVAAEFVGTFGWCWVGVAAPFWRQRSLVSGSDYWESLLHSG